MKKVLTLIIVFVSFGAVSQTTLDWCGFDAKYQEKYNALTFQEQAEFDQQRVDISMAANNYIHENRAGVDFIVPVVVHIIHDNGAGNISDEQVEDAIRMLNEDFRRLNADSVYTRDAFLPYVGRAGFEFRLAKFDPSGNITSGILRFDSPLGTDADDNAKGISVWPQDNYFNIWVVNTIESSGTAGTILGYAEFPNWGMGSTYGIIIRSDRMGRIGTGTSDRTLTHEMGHCLGLYHTFQSGCGSSCETSGDDVCDTPPVDVSTQGCSETQNSCSNDVSGSDSPFSGDVVDQIENFMSYDDCQNMFSQGQVDRILTNMATITELQSLVSEANQAASGVDQLCYADLSSDTRYVCVSGGGGAISFKDWSIYGQNSWTWNFPGGNPSTSSLENPVIFYNTPGVHDVSLTVGNGVNTKSIIKQGYVLVSDPISSYPPIQESFESISSLPSDKWLSISDQDDIFQFNITNSTAHTGTSCVKMSNYFNGKDQVDELISAAVDLSPLTSVSLTFWSSYAQNPNTTSQDALSVYISKDCGATWSLRMIQSGSTLASASSTAASFTPSDQTEWKQNTVGGISTSYLVEDFMFKFVFVSDSGNNMYIDDINISGVWDTKPELYLPLDGAGARPDNEVIDWKSTNGIDTYEWELDTMDLFTSGLLQTGTTIFSGIDPDGLDTEFETSNLIHGQKYYWRVRTYTNSVPSTWSDTWEFTVATNGVGIGENVVEEKQFSVYPNPTNHIFTIQNITADSPIKVFNLMGQLIYSSKSTSSLHTIDVANWQKGVYLVEVNSVKKKVIVQ